MHFDPYDQHSSYDNSLQPYLTVLRWNLMCLSRRRRRVFAWPPQPARAHVVACGLSTRCILGLGPKFFVLIVIAHLFKTTLLWGKEYLKPQVLVFSFNYFNSEITRAQLFSTRLYFGFRCNRQLYALHRIVPTRQHPCNKYYSMLKACFNTLDMPQRGHRIVKKQKTVRKRNVKGRYLPIFYCPVAISSYL